MYEYTFKKIQQGNARQDKHDTIVKYVIKHALKKIHKMLIKYRT